MSELCKTCKKKFDSGIWMSSQFRDERVLLFCSDKCKIQTLEIKKGAPFQYTNLSRTYPDKKTKKAYYLNVLQDFIDDFNFFRS